MKVIPSPRTHQRSRSADPDHSRPSSCYDRYYGRDGDCNSTGSDYRQLSRRWYDIAVARATVASDNEEQKRRVGSSHQQSIVLYHRAEHPRRALRRTDTRFRAADGKSRSLSLEPQLRSHDATSDDAVVSCATTVNEARRGGRQRSARRVQQRTSTSSGELETSRRCQSLSRTRRRTLSREMKLIRTTTANETITVKPHQRQQHTDNVRSSTPRTATDTSHGSYHSDVVATDNDNSATPIEAEADVRHDDFIVVTSDSKNIVIETSDSSDNVKVTSKGRDNAGVVPESCNDAIVISDSFSDVAMTSESCGSIRVRVEICDDDIMTERGRDDVTAMLEDCSYTRTTSESHRMTSNCDDDIKDTSARSKDLEVTTESVNDNTVTLQSCVDVTRTPESRNVVPTKLDGNDTASQTIHSSGENADSCNDVSPAQKENVTVMSGGLHEFLTKSECTDDAVITSTSSFDIVNTLQSNCEDILATQDRAVDDTVTSGDRRDVSVSSESSDDKTGTQKISNDTTESCSNVSATSKSCGDVTTTSSGGDDLSQISDRSGDVIVTPVGSSCVAFTSESCNDIAATADSSDDDTVTSDGRDDITLTPDSCDDDVILMPESQRKVTLNSRADVTVKSNGNSDAIAMSDCSSDVLTMSDSRAEAQVISGGQRDGTVAPDSNQDIADTPDRCNDICTAVIPVSDDVIVTSDGLDDVTLTSENNSLVTSRPMSNESHSDSGVTSYGYDDVKKTSARTDDLTVTPEIHNDYTETLESSSDVTLTIHGAYDVTVHPEISNHNETMLNSCCEFTTTPDNCRDVTKTSYSSADVITTSDDREDVTVTSSSSADDIVASNSSTSIAVVLESCDDISVTPESGYEITVTADGHGDVTLTQDDVIPTSESRDDVGATFNGQADVTVMSESSSIVIVSESCDDDLTNSKSSDDVKLMSDGEDDESTDEVVITSNFSTDIILTSKSSDGVTVTSLDSVHVTHPVMRPEKGDVTSNVNAANDKQMHSSAAEAKSNVKDTLASSMTSDDETLSANYSEEGNRFGQVIDDRLCEGNALKSAVQGESGYLATNHESRNCEEFMPGHDTYSTMHDTLMSEKVDKDLEKTDGPPVFDDFKDKRAEIKFTPGHDTVFQEEEDETVDCFVSDIRCVEGTFTSTEQLQQLVLAIRTFDIEDDYDGFVQVAENVEEAPETDRPVATLRSAHATESAPVTVVDGLTTELVSAKHVQKTSRSDAAVSVPVLSEQSHDDARPVLLSELEPVSSLVADITDVEFEHNQPCFVTDNVAPRCRLNDGVDGTPVGTGTGTAAVSDTSVDTEPVETASAPTAFVSTLTIADPFLLPVSERHVTSFVVLELGHAQEMGEVIQIRNDAKAQLVQPTNRIPTGHWHTGDRSATLELADDTKMIACGFPQRTEVSLVVNDDTTLDYTRSNGIEEKQFGSCGDVCLHLYDDSHVSLASRFDDQDQVRLYTDYWQTKVIESPEISNIERNRVPGVTALLDGTFVRGTMQKDSLQANAHHVHTNEIREPYSTTPPSTDDSVAVVGSSSKQGDEAVVESLERSVGARVCCESERHESEADGRLVVHDYGEMWSLFREIPLWVEVLRAEVIERHNADPRITRLLTRYPSLRPSTWKWTSAPLVTVLHRFASWDEHSKSRPVTAAADRPVTDCWTFDVQPVIDRCVLVVTSADVVE